MTYLSALFIAILTVHVASGATPLYCSDVQSPANGSGHNTDLSQVTTLQYCIIDNCTIMRIDTGQQLDIVYTTESLLIVTPKDGHTSMVITKIDELLCPQYVNIINDSQLLQYIPAIVHVFIMTASTYTLIVHLLFEKLRTLFGKLLIFLEYLCGVSKWFCYSHYINVLLDNSKLTSNIPHNNNNTYISIYKFRVIWSKYIKLFSLPHVLLLLCKVTNF